MQRYEAQQDERRSVLRNGHGPPSTAVVSPPFRVLSPAGPRTPPSPPPPPRAPEPYKLAPPARAHRNSSFAIIAETEPSLANSGRTSPFRGRGFKGPLPRSRSRPQSPDENERDSRRRQRLDKRVSLSQQNSPKRSFLPQAAPTRSISSGKLNEKEQRRPSPKFGRRAPGRYTPSVINTTNKPSPAAPTATRRPPLQPNNAIRKANSQSNLKSENSKVITTNKLAPRQNGRLAPPPIRNQPGGKRFITPAQKLKPPKQPFQPAKAVSTEALGSPSKIPKPISASGKSGSLQSLLGEKTNGTPDKSPATVTSESESTALVNLLRQANSATGTSSVVSTTTSTAAQPLQIDATAILAERELAAKLAELERTQKAQQDSEPDLEANKAPPQEDKKSSQETTAAPPTPAPRAAKTSEQTANSGGGELAQTLVKHFGPNSPAAERRKKVATPVPEETPSGASTARNSDKTAAGTPEPAVNNINNNNNSSSRLNSTFDSASINTANEAMQEQHRPPSVQSLSSGKSADTGVSVDTVKGVSSSREMTGIHTVKKPQPIETLSGNVERNGDTAVSIEPAVVDGVSVNPAAEATTTGPVSLKTRWQKILNRWRQHFKKRKFCPTGKRKWLPSMRCLAKGDPKKGMPWPGKKKLRGVSKTHLGEAGAAGKGPGRWSRIKQACKCTKLREARWCQRRARVAPADAPTTCCPTKQRFGAFCRGLVSHCKCRKKQDVQRTRSIRAKRSITSVAAPPLSEETRPKLPDVLVEHNSVMRGAIPCLPICIAWFCLIFNVLIPGTGTVFSGLFNLCSGQPRFSATASPAARIGAFVVNIIVGFSQFFTILFCLVGWGWSIWWGVTMLRLARKYKRFKDSEAASHDPEARGPAAEHATLPAPGIRSMERAR